MSEENENRQDERFDDLVRSQLGEFKVEPSPRTWSRLNRNLLWKEVVRFNFTNLPWYSWVIVGSAVVLVGSLVYLNSGTESPSHQVTKSPSYQVTESPSSVVPRPSSHVIRPSSPPVIASAAKQPPSAPATSSVIASAAKQPPSAPATSSVIASAAKQPLSSQAPPVIASEAKQPLSSQAPPVIASAAKQPLSAPATSSVIASAAKQPPDPLFNLTPTPSYLKLKKVDNPKPEDNKTSKETAKPWRTGPETSLDLGLDIAPQMVYYKVPSGYFKYNYTFDVGGQFNVGRFSIQTAFAFTWSQDVGTYAVYYTKRDSIGYMYSVNSFTPDPEHPGQVVYQTTVETVYDSNNYVYDYNTQTTYYYLQFPLIIGYKVFKQPNWNLSVEAGGLYMLLLKKDEPNPTFFVPDTKVNYIQRESPFKQTNSFGLLAGVRFEYNFTKNFFLALEPTFNYYIGQVEDNGSLKTTQPWAIGLRTGLWYRIPFKTGK